MKLASSTILIYMLISFIKCGYSITRNPRLVCYYFNWGVYAPGLAKYSPQNINPYLCTHLIYAFAGFTADFRITSADKYEDIVNGGFKYFAKLKTYNPNLKLILALGGSNEQSTHFSPLSGDSKLRKKFSKQVVKFLRKYQFDGIDLVWQYPGYREGDSNDKKNYVLLVRDLLAEFKKESESLNTNRLLISIAIPPDIKLVGKGFDIKQLNNYVDWFNLLSYNYHTSYEPFVNHHSPLYAVGNDTELNTNFSVQAYLEAGADKNKITVGIPNYGRTYKLQNVSNTERGAPSAGPGAKSNTTKEIGSLPFYEICYKLKYEPGWTTVDTNASRIGPYAYNGDQWLGYDDENSAKAKAQYAINNDLGGVVIWNINFDDFRGLCNNGNMYPFIEAVKEALFSNNEILRSSTTMTPPTTPDPGVDFDCTELDEGLHPHPTNTSIYYNCVSSGPAQYGVIARELVCPTDMSFNATSKMCEIINLENNSDLPVTSDASSSSSSSPASTMTTTEKLDTNNKLNTAIIDKISPATPSLTTVSPNTVPTTKVTTITTSTPISIITPTTTTTTSTTTSTTTPSITTTSTTTTPAPPTTRTTETPADSSNNDELTGFRKEIDELRKTIATLQATFRSIETSKPSGEFQQPIRAATTTTTTTKSPSIEEDDNNNKKSNLIERVQMVNNKNNDFLTNYMNTLQNDPLVSLFLRSQLNNNDDNSDETSSFFDILNISNLGKLFDNTMVSLIMPSSSSQPNSKIIKTIEISNNNNNNNDVFIKQNINKQIQNEAIVLPWNGQRKRIIFSEENAKNQKNIISRFL